MTTVKQDVRAAVPGWLVARALVAVARLGAVVLVHARLAGHPPEPYQQGLYAWDGSYYRAIAAGGYGAVDRSGVRFHPLLPVLGQGGLGVLLLANLGALAAGALVHRLVVEQTGDRDLARRAATLVGLAPPAFVLVWAYAEGPFLAVSAGLLLALRARRWWWAAALGLVATLLRPTGVYLVVPVAVALWQDREQLRRPGAIAALVAPGVAMGGFLLWVGHRFGDMWLPLRVQDDLRGGTVLAPIRLVQGIGEIATDPLGDGLHIPFAIGIVALTWVAIRRLPAVWSALAVVTALLALSAGNLNSVERYAFGCVPLVVALALVTSGRWWKPAVAASAAALTAMATMAWYGSYVP